MNWQLEYRTRLRHILDSVWGRSTGLPAGVTAALTEPFLKPPHDGTVIDLSQPSPTAAPLAPSGRTLHRGEPIHPFGLPALRELIAADTGAVDPEDGVLVTPGATGAFHAALDAFVRPGRPVVLLTPCSPLFALGAAARRARVRWVPSWVEEGRLRCDFDVLSRAMRGAALFAVADPGNPHGAPLADDDADRLRWAADRSDTLLYVDESYRRYRGPVPARRLAELAPGRTLVAGSVSAGHGLGSVRVGWLTGQTDLVRACGLAQSVTTPFVPPVCQELASRAMQSGGPAGVLDGLLATRRDSVARLREMGLVTTDPLAGYFLWADVSGSGRSGRAFAERLLAEEGVRVGPGDLFGPGGERFVRVSVAAEPGRLREGLSRLARFVGFRPPPAPAARPATIARPEFSRA